MKLNPFFVLIGISVIGFVAIILMFGSPTGNVVTNFEETGEIGIEVGDIAPNLSFKTIEGETLSIDDLKGKPAILQGFASWCASCKFQAQEIRKALVSLSDEVQVVSIDIWRGETSEQVKKNYINNIFSSENEIPKNWQFTAYEPDFASIYEAYSMDQTYILDENGKILFKDSGITTSVEILDILE